MEFARPDDSTVWFLRINLNELGPVPVVTFEGRVFSATVAEFGRVLEHEAIEGRRVLVLDFTLVDYINGQGMRLLDAAAARARSMNMELVVCGLTPIVRTTFDLAGASANLTIEPSRDAALRRFA